jgi:hypothetical protein
LYHVQRRTLRISEKSHLRVTNVIWPGGDLEKRSILLKKKGKKKEST